MFENEEITEPVEGEFDEDLDQDLPPPQFDPTKRIMAFNLTEHESVELMAKLRFDRIYARNHFFKAIVTAYLREDPIIRSFIDYLKKEQFDVKNRIFQKQKKVLSKIPKFYEQHTFSEQEIQDIFDVIEIEGVDL